MATAKETPVQFDFFSILESLKAKREKQKADLDSTDQEIKQILAAVQELAGVTSPPQPVIVMAPMPSPADQFNQAPKGETVMPTLPSNKVYKDLSIRWGILQMLAEHATTPLSSADIAKALAQGGAKSKSANFRSGVAAVISNMAGARKELEQVGTTYQISDHGKKIWQGIQLTPQWLERMGS